MRNVALKPGRKGSAYVVAVIILAIFASLAASFAAEASISLRKASNQTQVHGARLEAEGGMGYMSWLLLTQITPSGTGTAMLDDLAASLQSRLNGTANLNDETVGYDGERITVPPIVAGPRRTFETTLSLNEDGTVRLAIVGRSVVAARGLRMDFAVIPGEGGPFEYGVATRGKVELTGNARILGANDPSEAHVLAATYSYGVAACMTGNCQLDGDLSVSNPAASVSLTGNVSVGGESVWSGDIYDHIHVGVGPVEFPEADGSVFEPFATNIVDGSTQISGNKTFTNIRIAANTNPTFSGNITIRGVVFVETPNKVKFSGNLDLTGVVVTQDAGEEAMDDNYMHFTGNTTVRGVEELPDEPQFAGLKELPGTFLLAPGFSTKFTGNFGTISGAMGAEEFKFTGNAGGTVHGVVIVWGDNEFNLTGNSNLTIDRSGGSDLPAGFRSSPRFAALPRTYEEF